MKLRVVFWTLLFLCAARTSEAKITLPSFFSDNMVLQQQRNIRIFGLADKHTVVSVSASWNGNTIQTRSDDVGKWEVCLTTPSFGGPYTITISDGEPVVLHNVLVGEVWICSGQSNMEMKISDRVTGWEREIEQAAQFDDIRLLHVENRFAMTPRDTISIRNGGWMQASGESIEDFSAAAWFFGKELNSKLGCPVGLIETCWGGTCAEAWASAKALEQMEDFDSAMRWLAQMPESEEGRQAVFERELADWDSRIRALDKAFDGDRLVWGAPEYDDSSWPTVEVPGNIQDDFDGIFWMRKEVSIPASWQGKEITIVLSAVDDNDFTYFNGHSVGHTEGCWALRKYRVPAELVKEGKAVVAVRVHDFFGGAGIWNEREQMKIEGPDGTVISLAGLWKYRLSLDITRIPAIPANTAKEGNLPSLLYNAMIHPLTAYGIRGAIWYQGESNVSRALQYRKLLPLMIEDWREAWGDDFPFYIVQLANYHELQHCPEFHSEWAELREAQVSALDLDNTGLAVAIDIGDAYDIHPKNKKEVGRRLALTALANTYGQNIVYSGPMFKSFSIEGDSIRISFSHGESGLASSDGKALRGFCIAGQDRLFYWAEAVIEGDEVVVFSKEVKHPVAVRYAWADNPLHNLVNGAGLPAAPFRTDDWDSMKTPVRILFTGDSITDGGWGNSGGSDAPSENRNHVDLNHIFGHSYVMIAASALMAEHPGCYECFNRGISGNTLADLEARWQQDCIDLQPDYVSILIGTNDVDRSLASNAEEFDILRWERRYDQLLEKTRKSLPDVKLILCTPFVAQAGKIGGADSYQLRKSLIEECVAVVSRLAAKHGAVLVPFGKLVEELTSSTALGASYWIWDGIHPTPACHRKLADMWLDTVQLH